MMMLRSTCLLLLLAATARLDGVRAQDPESDTVRENTAGCFTYDRDGNAVWSECEGGEMEEGEVIYAGNGGGHPDDRASGAETEGGFEGDGFEDGGGGFDEPAADSEGDSAQEGGDCANTVGGREGPCGDTNEGFEAGFENGGGEEGFEEPVQQEMEENTTGGFEEGFEEPVDSQEGNGEDATDRAGSPEDDTSARPLLLRRSAPAYKDSQEESAIKRNRINVTTGGARMKMKGSDDATRNLRGVA